jgi:hypothetical protein
MATMMRKTIYKLLIPAFLGASFIMFVQTPAASGQGVEATYLYNLSDFSGPIPYMWASVSLDLMRNEVYVLDPGRRDVRIFNEQGMELYRFGSDGSLGNILDVSIETDGHILVLSGSRRAYSIIRCNYRGEPLSKIVITGMPPEFSRFGPDRMVYKNNKLYLADLESSKIIVADEKGKFERGYDLYAMFKEMFEGEATGPERKRTEADFNLGGFSVDDQGNILTTTPAIFEAQVISPKGEVRSFGMAGSGRGKFGVASGIAADQNGYIYVSDRLRCVVIVFDRDFNFVTEFGYRGYRPDNLVVPNDLAVDRSGRVYVSQAADRGVSVFRVKTH